MSVNPHDEFHNKGLLVKHGKPDVEEEPESKEASLPSGFTLVEDTFSGFAIRAAPGLSLLLWAQDGMWRKNLYAFLMALAMRLSEQVRFERFIGTRDADGAKACFGRLTVGEKASETVCAAASNTKARQAVAEALIEDVGLYAWLAEEHKDTEC